MNINIGKSRAWLTPDIWVHLL